MKKGQIYIISAAFILGILFLSYNYIHDINDSEVKNQNFIREYELMDSLLDFIYANYTTSCANLNKMLKEAYGDIKFAYLVHDGISYYFCDPYDLFDAITIEDDKIIIQIHNQKYSLSLDSRGYFVIVGSRDVIIRKGEIN